MRCLMAPFLSAILPRISVIAFRFAQPLLISVAIRFVTASSAEDNDPHRGYWIIVAAATTYIGMAVSLALHNFHSPLDACVPAQYPSTLLTKTIIFFFN